jgi:FkbM family methyltransferase
MRKCNNPAKVATEDGQAVYKAGIRLPGCVTHPPDIGQSVMNGITPPLPPVTPGVMNLSYLRQLVGSDASVILEIGAHDGSQTLQLLTLFPNARIFAFEPDPRALQKFKAHVTDPRVHLFEIAIGPTDGEAEFYVSSGIPPNASPQVRIQYPGGWDQSGSLRRPKTHQIIWPWCKFESKIIVPVRRLDTWAREQGVGHVDFIWADLQGAEGDLVAGGQATLARTRYLYAEYSNEEWYEGQPTLPQLMAMLPNFTILHRFTIEVLLKNTAL